MNVTGECNKAEINDVMMMFRDLGLVPGFGIRDSRFGIRDGFGIRDSGTVSEGVPNNPLGVSYTSVGVPNTPLGGSNTRSEWVRDAGFGYRIGSRA